MRMWNMLYVAGWLAVAGLLGQPVLAQDTVRLHGATSLEKLINAKKEAIETASSAKLGIVGNGSSRGLADLGAGAADIGMIGGSLKGVAAAANVEKAGSVDATGMKEIIVTTVALGMMTHPGAGVKSLTSAQVADIFLGKVTNWKEVGGADQAIKVVVPFPGDGSRITLQETLLGGADFAKDAVTRNNAKEIATVVAQLPGACAYISSKHIEGNVTTVTVDKQLSMPMALIVKGTPAANVQKVIDSVQQALK